MESRKIAAKTGKASTAVDRACSSSDSPSPRVIHDFALVCLCSGIGVVLDDRFQRVCDRVLFAAFLCLFMGSLRSCFLMEWCLFGSDS